MTLIDIPVELNLLAPEKAPMPLAGRLTWDSAAPVEVLLTITQGEMEKPWLIGRHLLAQGLHGRSGDMDVRIQPYKAEAHMLRIDLSSNHGQASLTIDRAKVGDFLARTWKALPTDQEQAVIFAALDAFDWAAERVADDAGEAA